MEQVNLQTQARPNVTLEQLRRNLNAAPSGDPFLEIFQNMMEQMGSASSEGMLNGLAPGGTELTMADLLAALGLPDSEENERDAQAMMSELAGMGLLQPAALQEQVQSSAGDLAAGTAGVSPLAERREGRQTAMQPDGAREEQLEPPKEQVQVLETTYTHEPSKHENGNAAQDYQAESRFRSAVEEAKRQLQQPAGQDGSHAVRQSPSTLDGAKGTFADTVRENRESAQALPLQQLDKGLSQQIALGRKEFSMKLKPESLGEITVKLTENEGKTTLSILTGSTETARAINHELAALREAMRPMGVEVQQAVPKPAESAGTQAQSQQFDMARQFAQQFGGQRQSFYNQPQCAVYSGPAVAEDPAQLFASPVLVRTGLDTYI